MISRLQVGIVNMLNPHPLLMRVLRKARERWRRDRQRVLLRAVQLPPGAKIVDLGGTEDLWRLIDHDFHVTLVNLPGFNPPVSDTDRFTVVQADCCELGPIFQDSSFDLSFSNATIEHVGEECRQARFAAEVRRLAPAYWIETPSPFCPIECHTGIPFYWYLPQSVREAILKDWSRRYPQMGRMAQGDAGPLARADAATLSRRPDSCRARIRIREVLLVVPPVSGGPTVELAAGELKRRTPWVRARKIISVTNDARCVTLSVWVQQKNSSRNTACCFRT